MFSRLKHTLKSTIIYSIGNISLKLIGLIMLPIYTDHLVVEEYGKWALLEVTSQVLVILIGVRLSISMIRHFSAEDNPEKKRVILFTSLILSLISIGIFNALLHPVAGNISNLYFDSSGFSRYFHLLIIWSSLEVLNRLTLDFIRIIQKPVLFILATIVRFITVLSLIIYFVAVRGMGIEGILLGQLLGSVLLFVFTIPYLIRRMKVSLDFVVIRQLVRYGFPLIFSSLSLFLLTMGDRYLIKVLLEYERLGIYAMSYKVSSVIKLTLIQAFQLGFIPIVFNMFDKMDIRRFVSKVFTYYSFILIFASLALSVFSKEIIYTFARDPKYYESFIYIPFMLLAFCFQGQQYVFTIGLHYVKKIHFLVWITLISALLNLGLNWFLLPRMGLYGSVIAVNVSSLLMAWLTYSTARRFYAIPYEIKKVMLLFVAGISLFFLTSLIPDFHIAIRIGLKLLIIALFPFILYFFKFYESVELQRISQIWNTWRNPAKWKKNVKRLMDEGLGDDMNL